MPPLLPNSFIFLESECVDLCLGNSETPNRGKKELQLSGTIKAVYLAQTHPPPKKKKNQKSRVRSREGEHKSTQYLN